MYQIIDPENLPKIYTDPILITRAKIEVLLKMMDYLSFEYKDLYFEAYHVLKRLFQRLHVYLLH